MKLQDSEIFKREVEPYLIKEIKDTETFINLTYISDEHPSDLIEFALERRSIFKLLLNGDISLITSDNFYELSLVLGTENALMEVQSIIRNSTVYYREIKNESTRYIRDLKLKKLLNHD